MDHRIGPHFLKTSVGFGGSCFQKDILNLVYLCKYYGLEKVAEYWHQVVKINDYQKSRFVTKIINKSSGEIKNKKITILGWAFKKDTNDSRESAAIQIAVQLINNGAKVSIYDPKVRKNQIIIDLSENFIYENFTVYQDPFEAIKDSNSIAIVTEWNQFKSLPWDKFIKYVKQPANIFDGRNLLDKEALENLGYNFYSIGK
jgi:UDPglucose 6-dehydrogenase